MRGEDILNKMWCLSISANVETLLRGNVVIIDRYTQMYRHGHLKLLHDMFCAPH